MLYFFLITVANIVLAVFSAPEADKVTSLPGYKGELPSTHYSGYIPVGSLSKVPGHLHYWFIESTADSSEPLPVVLWLNGGTI